MNLWTLMFHYLVQHLDHLHHYSPNVESDDWLNYDRENESGEQCSPIQPNENKHCGDAKILQGENAEYLDENGKMAGLGIVFQEPRRVK